YKVIFPALLRDEKVRYTAALLSSIDTVFKCSVNSVLSFSFCISLYDMLYTRDDVNRTANGNIF
ncbi:MAG TPA: hypothetical protein PK528_09170, partial [Syntrophorhabdus sp.]|nr:hypothetical protein [Syntrophorhabdus sp.]